MVFDTVFVVPGLAADEGIVMSSEHPSPTVPTDLATDEFTNPLTEPKSSVTTGSSDILTNKAQATMATGQFMISVVTQLEVPSNVAHKACALIGAYINCIRFVAPGGDERQD
jgi:hypothetical protein